MGEYAGFSVVRIPHRTDEGDVGLLAVEDLLVRADPEASHPGQHVQHLGTGSFQQARRSRFSINIGFSLF